MTGEQKSLVGRLARCKMQVASWEKRFIRNLCSLPSDAELTERQAQALQQVHYKYRKQLGEPDLPKPPAMEPSDATKKALERQNRALVSARNLGKTADDCHEDLQRLRQWNSGEARHE